MSSSDGTSKISSAWREMRQALAEKRAARAFATAGRKRGWSEQARRKFKAKLEVMQKRVAKLQKMWDEREEQTTVFVPVQVVDSGESRVLHKGDHNDVYAMVMDPAGRFAVSGHASGAVIIYDLKAGTMKIIHHNEKPAVCALAITADGRHAFAAGNGGDIWIIDTERGTAAKMINNTYSINALVLSADEQTLVASDTRGCLMAFDLLTRARIWVSDNDDSPVLCLAIDPVAKHVFSGDDGGDIIQWDIASGKKLNTNFSLEAGVLSLSFTPDGSKIVVGTDKKDIDVYSRSGDHIGSFDQRTPTNAVAVAPDGKRFVATFDEKDIVFAEIHNDEVKIIRVLSGHTSFVNSLAVTPDGASVISASTDGSVRLWKLQESAGEKV